MLVVPPPTSRLATAVRASSEGRSAPAPRADSTDSRSGPAVATTKSPAKACQRLQNLVGVLLARGFAGNDDRAGPDISPDGMPAAAYSFRTISLTASASISVADRSGVKYIPLRWTTFFFTMLDARRGVAARPVLDRQSAKYQLGGGGADIDAHAADHPRAWRASDLAEYTFLQKSPGTQTDSLYIRSCAARLLRRGHSRSCRSRIRCTGF